MLSQPPISIDTDKMEASSKKAVIWDMDGIIVDTAQYHMKGWQTVFQKRGANYTEEDYRLNTGMRNDSIIRSMLGDKVDQYDIMAITREKDEVFRQIVSKNIRPFPGVLKLITSLKANKFKIAIASSALIENIQLITRSLKIHNCFDAIVSGWETTKGKPNPQIFLLAAEKLGVETESCIVIEDAIVGVTASKRAGMCCLAVTNTNPKENLRGADLVIDTLEEITIDILERLLHQHKQRSSKMERSLVLIKPDAMRRGLAGTIITRLEKQSPKLVAIKMVHLDKALARRLYAIHKNKSFFDNLVDYISSVPIVAAVFEGEGAIAIIRKTMGATDPAKAESGTIRSNFGLDTEHNSVHGSDSVETAEKEIKLFFSKDEIFNYNEETSK
jgi:beta-phosphoglucomutase family hydrolase